MRRDETAVLSVVWPVRLTHSEQRTWGRAHDAHAALAGRDRTDERNLCIARAVPPPRILLGSLLPRWGDVVTAVRADGAAAVSEIEGSDAVVVAGVALISTTSTISS